VNALTNGSMIFNWVIKKSNFFFSKLGLRLTYIDHAELNKFKWINNLNISTILDIGANKGQFASNINKHISNADIYSFEPLAKEYNELLQLSKTNSRHRVFHTALGNTNLESVIFRNDYSPSSSLLKLGDAHLKAYPEFNKVHEETIKLARLDDFVLTSKLTFRGNIFVKIDVQGYEKQVLEGGFETIKKASLVLIEIGFDEMYESQPLFDEIYMLMKSLGFEIIGINTVASDPVSGKPLFADIYFTPQKKN
jgi:FkbM family methyltransferase